MPRPRDSDIIGISWVGEDFFFFFFFNISLGDSNVRPGWVPLVYKNGNINNNKLLIWSNLEAWRRKMGNLREGI